MQLIMNGRCEKCGGRIPVNTTGARVCPQCTVRSAIGRVKQTLTSNSFASSSPAPFIGRIGYPFINVGILAPPQKVDNTWEYDAPKHWAASGWDIPSIADKRASLVNSRFKAQVKSSPRLIEAVQDVGMAATPADVEVTLKDIPSFSIRTYPDAAPTGPAAMAQKLTITSNPDIPTKVEKVVSDTDLRASNALAYLYTKGIDENHLTKLLSVGTLGLMPDRKLVPTRWAITATDDMLGKHNIAQIKDLSHAGDCRAYAGEFLGNHYLFLCFPGPWAYELFEMRQELPIKNQWSAAVLERDQNITQYGFLSQTTTHRTGGVLTRANNLQQWTTDWENYNGRKRYAENCVGGYYTVRLALTEKMLQEKRQWRVLALRIITNEYSMPLGVWVTREASRKALQTKEIKANDIQQLITLAQSWAASFGGRLDALFRASHVMNDLLTQRTLDTFSM